jgi:chromosomal replication initiation ATPase DnaA
MKLNIFNQYVDIVCDIYSISKEELFKKEKTRNISEARYLLYYLCIKRPMKLINIQEFMAKNGYVISHSPVLHGIKSIENKIRKDKDYKDTIKQIKGCVTV